MDIQPILKIVASCPKGHSPDLEYEKDFLRAELKAGTLRYYCGECGDSWAPDLDHQKQLKALLGVPQPDWTQ